MIKKIIFNLFALVATTLMTLMGMQQAQAQTSALAGTLVVTKPSCPNQNDGQIKVRATGGSGSYQYSLQIVGQYTTGFATVDSFTNLSKGSYIITITDGSSSLSLPTTLVDPLPVTATAVLTNPTGGTNNGSIALTVSGGTPPYQYQWYTGDSTATITGLAPYTYYGGNIIDANGCYFGLGYRMDSGSSALKATFSGVNTNPTCYSPTQPQTLNYGVNATGGTAPYTYSFDGGAATTSSYSYSNGPGVHTVTIRDAANAVVTISDTFTRYFTSQLTLTATVTNATNGFNGSAILTATGGTPPYNYGGPTANLSVGSHYAYVYDSKGCYTPLTFYVNDSIYTPMSLRSVVLTPACPFQQGRIYVNVTGGYQPYRYRIDTGAYDQYYNASQDTGAHILYVKDALDSIFTYPFTIVADHLNATGTVTNASGGLNNGVVVLNVTGGVSPYRFQWQDNTTNAYDSILPVGSTYVSITDTLGCNIYRYFTIDSGSFRLDTVVLQPTACQSGEVQITGKGGYHPYRDLLGNTFDPNNNYGNLSAGTYTYTILDARNDTARFTVTIGSRPVPLVITSYSTTNARAGTRTGSMTVNVTGGVPPYHYSWNGSGLTPKDANFLDSVRPGNYSVNVFDTTGCNVYQSNIYVNDSTGQPLTGIIRASSLRPCNGPNGGAVHINMAGGTKPYRFSIGGTLFSPQYNGNNYSFYNLTAGVYPVTVIDATGDTFRNVASVASTRLSPPINIAVTGTNATGGLNNGAVVANVTGGVPPYSYQWNTYQPYRVLPDTTSSISGLAPGQYYVGITDSLGCSDGYTVLIDTGSSALVATGVVTNDPCYGQASIRVTPRNGTLPYEYQIDGGGYRGYGNSSFRFDSVAAGPRVINVRDAAGTIYTFRDTVAAQPSHISYTATVTNATGGSATGAILITPSGGVGRYDCYWRFDGTSTLNHTGLAAGRYQIELQDSFCSIKDTVAVGTGSSALSATAAVTNVGCYGDSTGAIIVSATGANQPLLCKIGTGAYSNTFSFSNLKVGSYTITVKDNTGATVTVSASVSQPGTAVTVTGISTNPNGSQANGTITLTIAGGTAPYTTHWNDILTSPINRSGLHGGNYGVAVNDSNGCVAVAAFYLDSNVTARAVVTSTRCNADSTGSIKVVASGGSAPYQYRLGAGAYQSDSVFRNLPAGSYAVTVKALGNDSFSLRAITITQPTAITVTGAVVNTPASQSIGSITLTVAGGRSPYTYSWGAGITTRDRTGLGLGSYTVTVSDSLGCVATKTFNIISNSIATVNDGLGLSLSPNPAVKEVTVNLHQATGAVSINVYNTIGQLMMTKAAAGTGTLKTTLSLETLPAGIYLVQVKGATATATSHLVVTE